MENYMERAAMEAMTALIKCRHPFHSGDRVKILVTGAAGFIGMTTSLRLLARGDEVVGLDNLNDYYEVSLKENRLKRLTALPGFRFVKLDVGDRAGMEKLFAEEKFDKVIHLAASPLVAKGYISTEYGQAVIDNTLTMVRITFLMKA